MNKALQLGSSGNPSENFHGVGIGPLTKILAVKWSPELRAALKTSYIK